MLNLDKNVIEDFGKNGKNIIKLNSNYEVKKFLINILSFSFEMINKNSEGFDMGCGSGRWAKFTFQR